MYNQVEKAKQDVQAILAELWKLAEYEYILPRGDPYIPSLIIESRAKIRGLLARSLQCLNLASHPTIGPLVKDLDLKDRQAAVLREVYVITADGDETKEELEQIREENAEVQNRQWEDLLRQFGLSQDLNWKEFHEEICQGEKVLCDQVRLLPMAVFTPNTSAIDEDQQIKGKKK